MSKNILFIFEGEKTEPKLYNQLKNIFLADDNPIIHTSYKANIYDLYEKLTTDDGEFFNILDILAETDPSLTEVVIKVISQTYLFFDYDPNDHRYEKSKVDEMLNFFNDEVENGKLFISYPMVEAFKHATIKDFLLEEHRCIDKASATSRKYKKIVNNIIEKDYTYFSAYNKDVCKDIFLKTFEQVSWITDNTNSSLDINKIKKITQEQIHESEYNKFLLKDKIAILSCIPLMITDYLEVEKIESLLLLGN